jgi:hypothetical protein
VRIPNTVSYDQSFRSLLYICRAPVEIIVRLVASVLFVDFPINIEVGFIRKQYTLKEVRIFFVTGQKLLEHFEVSICC